MLFNEDHFLIVDCPNVVWRVHHAMKKNLSLDTHIIYGFFKVLSSYQTRVGANKLVFCWDEGVSKRYKLCPTYKANRGKHDLDSEDRKRIDKQIYALKNYILREIGFRNNFKCNGYEADDLIASIVMTNSDSLFTIVSSDKDLFQLLRYGVQMLQPHNLEMYDESDLIKEYGINSKQWWRVKAIAGCKADSIPGCKEGIGEKTAAKYLMDKMNKDLKSYQTIRSFCKSGKINENKRLVKLPFDNTPIYQLREDELSREAWVKMMKRYNIQKLKPFYPG